MSYTLTLGEIAEIKNSRNAVLKKGDILLKTRWVKDTLASAILVKSSKKSKNLVHTIIRKTAKDVNHEYLVAALSSQPFSKKLQSKAQGRVLRFVNLKNLSNLKVTIPPTSKQKTIAKKYKTLLSNMQRHLNILKKAEEEFSWNLADSLRAEMVISRVFIPNSKNWRKVFLPRISKEKRKSFEKKFSHEEKELKKLQKNLEEDYQIAFYLNDYKKKTGYAILPKSHDDSENSPQVWKAPNQDITIIVNYIEIDKILDWIYSVGDHKQKISDRLIEIVPKFPAN